MLIPTRSGSACFRSLAAFGAIILAGCVSDPNAGSLSDQTGAAADGAGSGEGGGLPCLEPPCDGADLDPDVCRNPGGSCVLEYQPGLLSLGPADPGQVVIESMLVRNIGDASCRVRDWELLGCDNLAEGRGASWRCNSTIGTATFEVSNAPPHDTLIHPGDEAAFEVTFTAPSEISVTDPERIFFASLVPWFHSACDGGYTTPAWNSPLGANIMGELGGRFLDVSPDHIDFGAHRLDCANPKQGVVLRNAGSLAVTIEGIELQGCSPAVALLTTPELPILLPSGAAQGVTLEYTPDGVSGEDCTLLIHSDATKPTLQVAVHGKSTDATAWTDTFTQSRRGRSDILFVLDDSPSMSDEQALLADQLPDLIAGAIADEHDYHLAVTTTDLSGDAGLFQGSPPVVTSAHGPQAFASNCLVGVDGSAHEQGIGAAWAAVTGPNVADTTTPCQIGTFACPADTLCIDGTCQGLNAGFMRPDAELVVLFITDEDDDGSLDTGEWADRFRGLKWSWSGAGVRAHGLLAMQADCSENAAIGQRYMELVRDLGGQVEDLCSEDFGDAFGAVADSFFGLATRFYPSLPPLDGIVEVRIDGTPCGTDWLWDPDNHAVVFDPGGACMPGDGQVVSLSYEVSCSSE